MNVFISTQRLLAVAILAAGLSACGGGGSSEPAAATPLPVVVTPPPVVVTPKADVTLTTQGGNAQMAAGAYGTVLVADITCDTVAATGLCTKPVQVEALTRKGEGLEWGGLSVDGEWKSGYFAPNGDWVRGEDLWLDRPGQIVIDARNSLDNLSGASTSVSIEVIANGGTIAVVGTPSTVTTSLAAVAVKDISRSAFAVVGRGTIGSFATVCEVECHFTSLYGWVTTDQLKLGEQIDVFVDGVWLLQFSATAEDVANGWIRIDTTMLAGVFKNQKLPAGKPIDFRFVGAGTGTVVIYGLGLETLDGQELFLRSANHGTCPADVSYVGVECRKG